MINKLLKQWVENKHKLKEYFKTTKQEEYYTYESIVKKIFELCIPDVDDFTGWNLNKMTVIDDGDYEGTQIFIIPADVYKPQVENYVTTNTYYGSCSCCDTLQSISKCGHDLPSDKQVNEYMTLALHLVQKIRPLGGVQEGI